MRDIMITYHNHRRTGIYRRFNGQIECFDDCISYMPISEKMTDGEIMYHER
jgi:hypothetical protein